MEESSAIGWNVALSLPAEWRNLSFFFGGNWNPYKNGWTGTSAALRIMGSQNWWFGDPRTLLYRVKPLYRRVQWFLGRVSSSKWCCFHRVCWVLINKHPWKITKGHEWPGFVEFEICNTPWSGCRCKKLLGEGVFVFFWSRNQWRKIGASWRLRVYFMAIQPTPPNIPASGNNGLMSP